MKLRITNTKDFEREFQFYKINKYLVFKPFETKIIDISNRTDNLYNVSLLEEINFYKRLNGFKVETLEEENVIDSIIEKKEERVEEFVDTDSPKILTELNTVKVETLNLNNDTKEESVETASVDTEEESSENLVSNTEVDFNEYTDIELKSIISNMGIKTTARNRAKLESIIMEFLTNNPDKYLEEFI